MDKKDDNVRNDGEKEATAGEDASSSDSADPETSGDRGASPLSAPAKVDKYKAWATAASAEDVTAIKITPKADSTRAGRAEPSKSSDESLSEAESEDSN